VARHEEGHAGDNPRRYRRMSGTVFDLPAQKAAALCEFLRLGINKRTLCKGRKTTLVARGLRWGRRFIAGRRGFWSVDDREHGGLPRIPLTETDRRPVSLSLLHRTVVLSLHRSTPLAEPPSLIACLAQERRSFLIGFGQMVAKPHILEHALEPFLNGWLAVNRTVLQDQNRVLSEKGGDGGRIAFVESLVTNPADGIKLLG
jgi:hypothetical protein